MRSEERKKKYGEVFTPPALVEQMLDQLPPALFSDPSKTFCDPAGCGNGNFLVAVVRRKIEAGLTPLQALSSTFGVDIMDDNVTDCRKRLLQQAEESSGQQRTADWVWTVMKNIVVADALTYDFSFEDPRSQIC